MEHTLIQKLVSNLPVYTYPKNTKKKEKKTKYQPQMVFVSTKFIEVPNTSGEIQIRTITETYKRTTKKEPSKRDQHRMKN